MGTRALEESLAAAAAPEEQGLLEDVKGLLKEGGGPVKENAVEQEENAAAKLAISTREATSTQAQGGCGSPAAHADSVPPVLPASAPFPLEDGKGPVKDDQGPVKDANGPVGERKGSVKDEKRPVEEAKGPVKEAGVGLRLKRVDGRVTVEPLNPTP